jgi:catechol 2,3-dioxygenase-like lactoylglutathione lyase family enzyme
MRRLLFVIVLASLAAFAQLPAPNTAGVSMGHLHLMSPDPEPMKKLFVEVLGAEVVKAGPLELLKLPGMFIVAGRSRNPVSGGSDGSTVAHIGFAMKSYTDLKAKLTAAGVTFARDNAEAKQIMANFPDKLVVEFTEVPSIKAPVEFHHIHLASTDQEKLRAWYVKTFGAVAGKRGNFLAAMIPGGEVDFRVAQEAQAPTKGRSLDHIGFEVKGLEEFCKKLKADGMAFDVDFRDVPAIGLKIAFISDPDGTRIELTEGLAAR